MRVPDSAFLSSAKPVTKPSFTFHALRPVTGCVRTAGWCESMGGRLGPAPQRSRIVSSGVRSGQLRGSRVAHKLHLTTRVEIGMRLTLKPRRVHGVQVFEETLVGCA